MENTNKKGFTLVELAIVLVIIGLLVGGVLQGQELIKQAKVRNIIAQISDINRAALAFRSKYDQFPGDFSGATAIWGANGACPGTASFDLISQTTTCNGNADGFIDTGTEKDVFFQHLKNAGLISSATSLEVAGTYYTFSKTKAENIYITLVADNIFTNHQDFIHGKQYVLGGIVDDYNGLTVKPTVTPELAYGIDSKLDDALPLTGDVRIEKNYSGSLVLCNDGGTPAQYAINTPTNTCSLLVKAAF